MQWLLGPREGVPKSEPQTTDIQVVRAASNPSAPGLADQTAGPLSPEHLEALSEANRRAQSLRAAGKLAAVNGWSSAVFSVLCAPFALFGLTAAVMGVGLGAVAWNEFRGRRLLLAFDPRGPRVLGWNQIGFLALLCGYSLWRIYLALTTPNPYAEQIQAVPEIEKMIGDIGNLYVVFSIAVYGGVILSSAVFQGGSAAYYFSRSRHVLAMLNETPPWIIELQKRSAAA